MYIGHVGAALAAKRVRATIGLLPLLVATYVPDWVDTGMCLAGSYDPIGMLSHSIPAVLSLAVLGFGCIAGISIEIAKIIFFVAVVLFLISALVGIFRGRTPTVPSPRRV